MQNIRGIGGEANFISISCVNNIVLLCFLEPERIKIVQNRIGDYGKLGEPMVKWSSLQTMAVINFLSVFKRKTEEYCTFLKNPGNILIRN
jgi:hypothetical protein